MIWKNLFFHIFRNKLFLFTMLIKIQNPYIEFEHQNQKNSYNQTIFQTRSHYFYLSIFLSFYHYSSSCVSFSYNPTFCLFFHHFNVYKGYIYIFFYYHTIYFYYTQLLVAVDYFYFFMEWPNLSYCEEIEITGTILLLMFLFTSSSN